MLSKTNEIGSYSDLESETRAIVMDFMGLVPLSCPPTSAYFKPFEISQGEISEFSFVKDFIVNNNTNRRSTPADRLPRRVASGRFSLTSSAGRIRRENSFRTIIRKRNKLVVLEENTKITNELETIDDTFDNTKGIEKKSTEHRKNGRTRLELNFGLLNNAKQKSFEVVKPPCYTIQPLFNENHFDPNDDQILRKAKYKADGTSVDARINSFSSSHGNSLILNNKENHYVDISKINSLEQLVNNGELSPVVVPLQNELKGLRLSIPDPVNLDLVMVSIQPLSPSAEVADTLRAIADQVQEEFAYELNGAVGKLVNFEKGKRLTFEVLKEVAMELTKDIAPGWSRIVLPLVLTQTASLALLILGYRSIVGKLVNFTTRYLCDDLDDEFFAANGGWDGVRNAGFREIPMLLEELDENSPE